jgi:hypothetical protein
VRRYGNPTTTAIVPRSAAGSKEVPRDPVDEHQAQAMREPLAVKLADSAGHVRIAANAAWAPKEVVRNSRGDSRPPNLMTQSSP